MPDPPVETVEKEYLVVGPHRVHGAAPGEKFKASLHPNHEALLVESGHVKVVEPKAAARKEETPDG